ncbi:MAG: hypothetical protein K0S04_2822 [Herbinix sp.]|jgi:hypothetical protein|nr:hypothetical protein [Herbinix sp.]
MIQINSFLKGGVLYNLKLDFEGSGNLHANQKLFVKKLIIRLFIFGAICFVFFFISGARFTSKQAINTNPWLEDTSTLLETVDSSPYMVYLYENSDKYLTVIAQYKFPFWKSNTGFWANKTEDMIKLVGWCNYNDGADNYITVVPVQSFDENVAFIEMGPVTDRQRKAVKSGEVLIFSWKKSINWNDLNGVAYSIDNQELYHLGYEIVNSTIHPSELRWLPSN